MRPADGFALPQPLSTRFMERGLPQPDERVLAALLMDAQSGNLDAYGQALRACLPIITATVLDNGVAADRVDAVLRDVLLIIHRALHTYDPLLSPLSWLRAIAARRAKETTRTRVPSEHHLGVVRVSRRLW